MADFTDSRKLYEWVADKIDLLTEDAKDVVREGAKEGEQLTKEFISSRGTAKSGKQGRIETGRMLNAVDSRVERDTDETIEAAFGWLDDKAAYFGFQEAGFTHTSGAQVEGMYALSDAADQVARNIDRKLNGVAKRV